MESPAPDPIAMDVYRLRADAPPIAPASAQRNWMDATSSRVAYRCLPLSMANSSGWEMRLPADVTVSWNGKPDRKAITVKGYDPHWPVRAYVQSHFGEGVLTFITGYLFRTSPGIAVWTSGPPNEPKDGIAPLTGLVETDWLPFPFTMNWRFTRPGEVTFKKGEVFCFVTWIDHARLGTVNPRIGDITLNPGLQAEYNAWTQSRADFIKGIEDGDAATLKEAWQRHYMQGRTMTGEEVPGHVTKRRLADIKPRAK